MVCVYNVQTVYIYYHGVCAYNGLGGACVAIRCMLQRVHVWSLSLVKAGMSSTRPGLHSLVARFVGSYAVARCAAAWGFASVVVVHQVYASIWQLSGAVACVL